MDRNERAALVDPQLEIVVKGRHADVTEQIEDPAADEGADDADDDVAQDPARTLARNDVLREKSRDESHDQPAQKSHGVLFPLLGATAVGRFASLRFPADFFAKRRTRRSLVMAPRHAGHQVRSKPSVRERVGERR